MAFAEPAAPAVFGDGHALIEHLVEQRCEILGAARPPARIAGLALDELGVARRLAIAHLIIVVLRKLTCHSD